MSKIETIKGLNDSEPQLQIVRTVRQLNESIETLPRLIEESLSKSNLPEQIHNSLRPLDQLSMNLDAAKQSLMAATKTLQEISKTNEKISKLEKEVSAMSKALKRHLQHHPPQPADNLLDRLLGR